MNCSGIYAASQTPHVHCWHITIEPHHTQPLIDAVADHNRPAYQAHWKGLVNATRAAMPLLDTLPHGTSAARPSSPPSRATLMTDAHGTALPMT